MKDNKSLFQRVKLYAIPGLITCAVIVFIYVFKGIWPWLYMTAMFIGAALIIRVASSEHTPSVERMAADE